MTSLRLDSILPLQARTVILEFTIKVQILKIDTKSISTDLGCADWNNRGHSNRVFSVKFIDDNTIISGGWDSVLHLWDIRQGKSVRSSFGPHVAGDTIDYSNG